MKPNLLLAILLFCSTFAVAQDLPFDSVSQRVSYTDSIVVEGLSQKDLYEHALKWFNTAFKGYSYTIDDKKKSQGYISGSSVAHIPVLTDEGLKQTRVKFQINIQTYDNSYRYHFTRITFQEFPSDKNANPPVEPAEALNASPQKNPKEQQLLSRTNENLHGLEENLKEAMKFGICTTYRWMTRYKDE